MGKQSPKSGARKVLGTLGYCLFLFAALLVGTTAGWVGQSQVFAKIFKKAFDPKDPQHTFGADTITLLILGCDEDIADFTGKILKKQARSDMMLIVKLDFDNNLVTGVSIPRDTRCKLPGYKMMKINAYHEVAKKGNEAKLTEDAVEFLLPGIHIDRVVTLDFDHFQALVDMVNGVPIDVASPLNYDDNAGHLHIHIPKGYQVLNGYNAMAFVRMRHDSSDFVREQRQKQFLLAFKQQSLKDWEKVPQLVNEGVKVLGDALSEDEIASLALFARKVPPKNIYWGQVPVKDIRHSSDLALDEDKVHDVLVQYRLIETHGGGLPTTDGTN